MFNISIRGILILLGIAVLIGAAVIILYRIKANRALQGIESGAHTSIPAPADTLSGIFKAVILILLIIICVNLGKLNTLLDETENVRDMVQNNNNYVLSELESLRSDIAATNSRVYSYDTECSDIDATKNTCTVKHTVRLKTFTDDTEVTLIPEKGTEIKMTKTGAGKYEAELTTELFRETGYEPGISITEGGTSYVEELTAYSREAYYWQICIPSLTGIGGAAIMFDKTMLKIENISMLSEYKHDYRIASAKLLVECNGNELDSMDVLDCFAVPYGIIEIPVNREYSKKETDNIRINLILTTEEGYTLDQLLFECKDGKHISYGNNYTITDKGGNKVF